MPGKLSGKPSAMIVAEDRISIWPSDINSRIATSPKGGETLDVRREIP